MRIARSLTVSPSMLCSGGGGGCLVLGGGCLVLGVVPGPRGGGCLVLGVDVPGPGEGAWSRGEGGAWSRGVPGLGGGVSSMH